MFLIQSGELVDHARDIIHADTQVHKFSLDLTVDEIHLFSEAGSLDFGGSEFEPASTEVIIPEKNNPEDDYGWWNLEEGHYRAVFNEELQNIEDTLAVISPHQHTNQAGIITASTLFTGDEYSGQLTLNFRVPDVGCNIKENARFAKLHILAD